MTQYDPITAMMDPMEDEQRLRALAEALRGRQQAADFYALSTVPNLQRAAENEQKHIQGAAERQGVLREALARRKAASEESRLEREFDAEQNRLNREQQAADRAEQRALTQTLAGMRADPYKGMLKPSAKHVDTYAQGKKLADDVSYLNGLYAQMNESQRAQLDQPWKEIGATLVDKVLPSGVGRRVREEKIYTDPLVRQYMAAGNRMTSNISALIAGLTVTGFEMEDRDKYSPFAAGVSQGDRQIKLENIQRDLLSRADSLGDIYPQLRALDSVIDTKEPDAESQEEVVPVPDAGQQQAPVMDELELAAQEAIAQGADPAQVQAALEEMRRGQQ